MYLLVGRRGSGKTLLAAEIGLARMRRGERVYANFTLVDWERGLRAGRIHSLMDCLDLQDCTVIIDEANLWTSSRQWAKIPPAVLSSWQQSRKRGLSFVFTSQHEERVDRVIRELCDWVLVCERVGLLPKWLPLFRVQWTYLEEVGEVRRGKVSRPEYRWVSQRVFAGYDTREDVDAEMLDSLHEYQKAITAGKDPDELGLTLPPRSEPAKWSSGQWVAIDGGTRADPDPSDYEALVDLST